jgi:replicative DNA helicase
MTPAYITAADLFGAWLDELERGEPPIRYRLIEPFDALDLRPGRLILFGGQPGSGKTAALLQVGVDMLRMNDSTRLIVANAEMAPLVLMERIAARLSQVPLSAIADRTLTRDETMRVCDAMGLLGSELGRLAFLTSPYTLEHLAAAATAFEADAMIVDYIQRFAVGDSQREKREQLESAAAVLRRFCDQGACVLVASAVARQRNKNGATYRGLGLASFRGSSELEYGADACYVLVPNRGHVKFQCEKNRFGPCVDIATHFDATIQEFAAAPAGLDAFDAAEPADDSTPRRRRGA